MPSCFVHVMMWEEISIVYKLNSKRCYLRRRIKSCYKNYFSKYTTAKQLREKIYNMYIWESVHMFRSMFRIVTISEVSLKFDNKKIEWFQSLMESLKQVSINNFKTFQSCGKFPWSLFYYLASRQSCVLICSNIFDIKTYLFLYYIRLNLNITGLPCVSHVYNLTVVTSVGPEYKFTSFTSKRH